ncbi:DUF1772 domain-containing protein [Chitinophaga pollutisoli]|uniref:DUF1772 domain-containing protein n=1 Tax=Chitinophaga pollutisoli TaxID=3133966 RepID=A0ABZ2YQR6_9BACT
MHISGKHPVSLTDGLPGIVFLAAVILTCLSAGIFYAYAVSVVPGLGRVKDSAYLTAYQSINRAILNPWFLIVFMAPVFLLPFSAWQQFSQPANLAWWALVAAGAIYITGVFGVTVACNVPLNEWLDKQDLASAGEQTLKEWRLRFEEPWNRWNVVRTAASVVSAILSVWAILRLK